MKLEQFIEEKLNKKIDYDGYYGYQCVDLIREYIKDVLEIEQIERVEGAKEIYEKYKQHEITKKYFDKVNKNRLEYGDIIVYRSQLDEMPGHTAIVIAKEKSYLIVLEQNGYKQDGTKIIKRSYKNALGGLRLRSKYAKKNW